MNLRLFNVSLLVLECRVQSPLLTVNIQYPAAYEKYRSHCKHYLSHPQSKYANGPATASKKPDAKSDTTVRKLQLPEGTALIIPPQKSDVDRNGRSHWIICLFTSRKFGRNKSSTKVILENTNLALEDMNRQLALLEEKAKGVGDDDGEVQGGGENLKPTVLWSCRFNAGLFGVDWKLSRRVLADQKVEVTVVRPSA